MDPFRGWGPPPPPPTPWDTSWRNNPPPLPPTTDGMMLQDYRATVIIARSFIQNAPAGFDVTNRLSAFFETFVKTWPSIFRVGDDYSSELCAHYWQNIDWQNARHEPPLYSPPMPPTIPLITISIAPVRMTA
jgi:hypothetical protein